MPASSINPYTASKSVPVATEDKIRLYSPSQIAAAAALGSLAAGGTMLALNFEKLNRKGAAIAAVLLGLIATISQIGLVIVLSLEIPGQAFWITNALIALAVAKGTQGNDFAAHTSAGGKLERGWKAILIVAGFASFWFGMLYLLVGLGN